MAEVVLAYPGSLEQRTGGYIYDRRAFACLEERGWKVGYLSLPPGFPFADVDAIVEARRAIAAVTDGSTLVVDSLVLGVTPEIAAEAARRLDLVALVHHPLFLETGISPEEAERFRASETEALRHPRRIIVTSPLTARTLTADMGVPERRVHVALPGVDPAPLAPGSGTGARLLCVGTLTPRKGHLALVEALAGLKDLDWRLDCAGSLERSPGTVAALRAAIHAHDLDGRVSLLGEVDGAALAGIYARSDLLVSASFYEGYGMALAEGLARGLPVIAAAGGAVADTVPEEAGLLVPVDDAAALAAALRRVLTEPGLRERLAEGARAVRERLTTWEDAAAGIEAALLAGRA